MGRPVAGSSMTKVGTGRPVAGFRTTVRGVTTWDGLPWPCTPADRLPDEQPASHNADRATADAVHRLAVTANNRTHRTAVGLPAVTRRVRR